MRKVPASTHKQKGRQLELAQGNTKRENGERNFVWSDEKRFKTIGLDRRCDVESQILAVVG